MGHDDDAVESLTDEEIKAIREMIKQDAHMRWLWPIVRLWIGWISAAITALYLSWDVLVRIVKIAFVKGA
jgi:hypothetical protein